VPIARPPPVRPAPVVIRARPVETRVFPGTFARDSVVPDGDYVPELASLVRWLAECPTVTVIGNTDRNGSPEVNEIIGRSHPDFATLQSYCYRVAGVVGLMAAEIFGYRDPATLKYAENLGTAFQLTNIIRDVGEDARRGRVYLPLEELTRFDVAATDIIHLHDTAAFRRLIEFQISRAEDYYRLALGSLPERDRKAQRPGLVMAAIYQKVLEEIRNNEFKVLDRRTSLTPIRKLWIAWRTWLCA